MGGYGNLKSLELGGYTKTRYDCIITLPILSLLPPRVCSIVPCGYRRGGDGVRRVHGRDALARLAVGATRAAVIDAETSTSSLRRRKDRHHYLGIYHK